MIRDPAMGRVSVAACECSPIVIEGLHRVLGRNEEFSFTGLNCRLVDALRDLGGERPAILLVDQNAGVGAALRLVAAIKNSAEEIYPVLWVSDLPESDALRALQLGVRGILRKDAGIDKLLECLREVGGGRIWMENTEQVVGFVHRRETSRLTVRERDVVRLVCHGLRNRQIAETLGITPGTVKVHLMHIFEKTGLKDRFALAVHGRMLPGMLDKGPIEKETAVGLKALADGVDQPK
jgi:two-component system nitrate/nitrite response regulator NarL